MHITSPTTQTQPAPTTTTTSPATSQASAPPPLVVGVDDLAPILGISARTLREWSIIGTIPSIILPGSRLRRYILADVMECLRRHARGGEGPAPRRRGRKREAMTA